jgi:hypothetical protein
MLAEKTFIAVLLVLRCLLNLVRNLRTVYWNAGGQSGLLWEEEQGWTAATRFIRATPFEGEGIYVVLG